MSLVEWNEMVEALATRGSDQSFAKRTRLWNAAAVFSRRRFMELNALSTVGENTASRSWTTNRYGSGSRASSPHRRARDRDVPGPNGGGNPRRPRATRGVRTDRFPNAPELRAAECRRRTFESTSSCAGQRVERVSREGLRAMGAVTQRSMSACSRRRASHANRTASDDIRARPRSGNLLRHRDSQDTTSARRRMRTSPAAMISATDSRSIPSLSWAVESS
jgi:hypothetical protein